MYTKRLRKKRRKRRLVAVVIITTLIFGIALAYLRKFVDPMIYEKTEAQVRTLLARAATAAARSAVEESDAYSELLTVSADTNGKILFIRLNTVRASLLALDISQKTMDNIVASGESGVKIQLGALTGLPVFAGTGPEVALRVAPSEDAGCEFRSEFVSAGINQTHHRVYITIEASAAVVMPRKTAKITVSPEILLVENIIVGEVPDVYLGSGIKELLPLVP